MHRDLAEYVEAKRNILRYQNTSGIAVLNRDNETARHFAGSASGEVRFFSSRTRVDNGFFFEGGTLYEAAEGKVVPVITDSEILLPGVHNIENYMAAFTAVRGLVRYETIRRVGAVFGGVAHRGASWFGR